MKLEDSGTLRQEDFRTLLSLGLGLEEQKAANIATATIRSTNSAASYC
jgi:hypothetical protein